MSARSSHQPVDTGEWQQWEHIWQGMKEGRDTVLYTSGHPETIMQLWQRAYFEDLWESMKGRAERARFLELGAGRGTTSMYLASRNCDVTLLDLAPAGLELAVRNFRAHGFRPPDTRIADARNTGLPSASYDCIYNIGLLEHFDDPVPVLKESLRLLKPGGLMFMVIIPEGSPWRSFPVRVTFNPIVMGSRLVMGAARRISSRARKRSATARSDNGAQGTEPGDMVRTTHSRQQYVRWLAGLGQTDVQCIPYNPYFRIYKTRWLERWVNVPLYRAHLYLRRRRARYPLLQTSARVASCDLLLCRKHEGAHVAAAD